ncbi:MULTISPECIES: protealysin inhibitor emfourin [unclassified Pseudomonas]|uniref:protealysin inhibitor emfourin n=1 Tax=unclassified Pseudomonas TaxID=196821 RepID=UPI0039B73F20
MKTLPELDDKAVVRLSRQGGVAAIHALTRPREIEFAQCDLDQRTRISSVLAGCLPLTSSTPGRGDQRFFQIEVRYRANDQDDEMVLQVPEDQAPGELVHLWDKGEVL